MAPASTTRRLLPLAIGGAAGLAVAVKSSLLAPFTLVGLGSVLAFTAGYSSAWSP